MKLTKQQILDLNDAFLSSYNLKGVQFAYAVAKNMRTIKPILEDLQKQFEPSERYIEFQKEVEKLKAEYPDKDIPKEKIEDVESRYKDVIDERIKQETAFKKVLEEEVEIDLHMVHIDFVPNAVTPDQMTKMFPMIDDEKKIDILPANIN